VVTEVTVRSIEPRDKGRWRELFQAYRDFYQLDQSDEIITRVWGWLSDSDHEVQGLVAEIDGVIRGIAHYRRFSRPSTGSVGIWLDDLYSDKQIRGRGVGRALISQLTQLAAAEGKSVVRWITAADNTDAQVLYDRLAKRTDWITYDASPSHGS